eukprot:scaffold4026_cov83-Skeletonema_dohrnii-CCMP3373.AAC.1
MPHAVSLSFSLQSALRLRALQQRMHEHTMYLYLYKFVTSPSSGTWSNILSACRHLFSVFGIMLRSLDGRRTLITSTIASPDDMNTNFPNTCRSRRRRHRD